MRQAGIVSENMEREVMENKLAWKTIEEYRQSERCTSLTTTGRIWACSGADSITAQLAIATRDDNWNAGMNKSSLWDIILGVMTGAHLPQ